MLSSDDVTKMASFVDEVISRKKTSVHLIV